LAGVAGQVSSNTAVQRVVEDTLSDLRLQDRAEIVVTGVASRLMAGDQDSAATYLANKAGLSRAEAESRLQNLKVKVQAVTTDFAQRSADTARVVGWTAFTTMLLGAISACSVARSARK